jgi:hypothetical protein
VAFWITWLMIVWKPSVMPLSWFCSVVVMLMSPQIRVAVPADAHTDAIHAGRAAHRHRATAADAVEHVVADDAAAVVEAVVVDSGLGRQRAAGQRQGGRSTVLGASRMAGRQPVAQ